MKKQNMKPSEIKERGKIMLAMRKKRESLGISQENLAKRIRGTQSDISSYENNRTGMNLSTFMLICKELNVDLIDLFEN